MPWALRSVMPRLAAMSRSRAPGSCAMHSSTRAWLVRKLQFAMIKQSTIYSSNILLVFNCGYRLKGGPGDRPPKLPAGAGHVQRLILIAWAARAAGARHEFAGPDPGQAPADVKAAAAANAFTGNDLKVRPLAGLTGG